MSHSRAEARFVAARTTLLVLVVTLGCGGHRDASAAGRTADSAGGPAPAEADANSGGAAPQPVVGARTAIATVQSFATNVSAMGTVAGRPGRYAELSAPAPTRVVRIFVVAGDHVDSGAPLVAFERAPFDAAAASAAAALTAAQRAYERAARLADAGIVPRKDVDVAQADLAQAKNNAVSAQLAQARATLLAPLAGVVTHVSAVLGAPVDASQPVVGVADPSALDVVLTLAPSDGAQVHAGAAVTLTSGQSAIGEPLGTGAVTTVGGTIDSASRSVIVRARIARPARALRIGETVFGRITAGVHRNAITVPVEALVPEGDGLKVFVVEKDGLAHARRVTVGWRTERFAEITDGVKAGETVVTVGAYGLDDSAKVVPLGTAARDSR
jgi:RND family efflux transporter MFP subunit